MRDLVCESGLINRRYRVAAADNRRGTFLCRFGHRTCDRNGSFIERFLFEHAHRTVPDDRLCSVKRLAKYFSRFDPNIETYKTRVSERDRDSLYGTQRIVRIYYLVVGWKGQLYPGLFRVFHDLERLRHHLVLNERFSNRESLRLEEGICHSTADQQLVHFSVYQ